MRTVWRGYKEDNFLFALEETNFFLDYKNVTRLSVSISYVLFRAVKVEDACFLRQLSFIYVFSVQFGTTNKDNLFCHS